MHDHGTFVVTIPKSISYSESPVGNVSFSETYTVNVMGALDSDKTVTVSASASGGFDNPDLISGDTSAIAISVEQGKNTWDSTDAYGDVNADGSLSGTPSTDTILVSGELKSAGTWTGVVQYSAEIN